MATDGNFQANPGYGNDANVGYSPGQTGTVPPGWAKFDFQMGQYNERYGKDNRRLFARYPLTFAVIWYPLMFLAAGMIQIVAQALVQIVWVNPLFGIIGFVLVWGVALFLIGLVLVGWPLMAMMMHRRRGGMFSEYFAWTDRFVSHADFDYYENPR